MATDTIPLPLFEDAPSIEIGVNGKKCGGRCGKVKPYSEFFRAGKGYHSYCKACCKESSRDFYRKNPKSPDIQRREHLRRTFNLTTDEYQAMFESQHGLCASCGNPEIATKRWGLVSLAVDHCHSTGKVRALLCNSCNVALGHLQEDTERIEQLLRYIRRFEE